MVNFPRGGVIDAFQFSICHENFIKRYSEERVPAIHLIRTFQIYCFQPYIHIYRNVQLH